MATNIFDHLRFPPRHYQVAAMTSFINYLDHPKTLPIHLLFNMATGSGKTYVMAAAMLELYRRGYRNFIFFVNSTNILTKTRDNFLHQNSPKYLFQPNIMIDGQNVAIREVANFSSSIPQAINTIFTTTQKLHSDLNQPRENRLNYSELARQNVVLIGDEAHHNNIDSAHQNNSDRNWESTVAKIINDNPHSILLEFTATLDSESPAIQDKYQDRVIYRYDLRQMCAEKYSKQIVLRTVDDDLETREIEAMIISEYRKLLAAKNHIVLKPVILFKSRTVYENKTNFTNFQILLFHLTSEQLSKIARNATGILRTAFEFFATQGISLEKLCQMLQQDFCPDNIMRVDGGQNLSKIQQAAINTLESPNNPYRAIFAVDMLKEGWDVLNLFDIVRLYETRDGKVKDGVFIPGKTTISEAQLIGRGARYCPFEYKDHPKFQRKFDNEETELKILEQLLYHTKHDVRYISEIKVALEDIGLINFRSSKTPQKSETNSHKKFQMPNQLTVILPSNLRQERDLLSDRNTQHKVYKDRLSFSDVPLNLLYAAMNRDLNFRFSKLRQLGFHSRSEFLTRLQKVEIVIVSAKQIDSLFPDQLLYIAGQALRQIAASSKLDI